MQAACFEHSFPPTLASPGVARHWVQDTLALDGPAADDVGLLVSELVTNSVLHAGLGEDDAIVVRARHEPCGTVRLEVRDSGDGFSGRSSSPERTGGGRGLLIVGRLCQDWGLEEDDGTLTWACYRPDATWGS